jgi:predicted phage terminase large subunit-like protein
MNKLLKRQLLLQQRLFKIKAKNRFAVYLNYDNPQYQRQWFHTLIADKCQELYEGKIKKLMIFVPPQHGKSEIVSRKFPAWALGNNPSLKIAGCSYSADLACGFSRSIQRTIDSPEYKDLFPDTQLPGRGIRSTGYTRNLEMFEIVNYGGFYKAVGVTGGLTGTPVDIGIIDDPVKDKLEAYSETYRNRVWDWYVDVFLTRLHNDSKQLLIMTRWHDDDLAGRILKSEGEEWEVIVLPAIKEAEGMLEDTRKIGEALWPEKHSLERLRAMERRSARTFAALYQQRPTVEGGNIILSKWFGKISQAQFMAIKGETPIHFILDTAYKEKEKESDGNDPSGIIAVCRIQHYLYIVKATKVYKNFPQLIAFLPEWVKAHGYTKESKLMIEPKANGISVVQQLRSLTDLNVTETEAPTDSKATRLNANSPRVECGRVILVEDDWNQSFVDEVTGFPAKAHDEYVDVLNYGIEEFLNDEIDIPDNIEELLGINNL